MSHHSWKWTVLVSFLVTVQAPLKYIGYTPCCVILSQITKFTGPTWGPPGSCRPQMGPMLVPWTLLSGIATAWKYTTFNNNQNIESTSQRQKQQCVKILRFIHMLHSSPRTLSFAEENVCPPSIKRTTYTLHLRECCIILYSRDVPLIRVYNVRTNQFVLDRTKFFSNDAYRQQVIT